MAERYVDEACISPPEEQEVSISPSKEQKRQQLTPKSEMSIVFLGKTGAGKSTLMRTMFNLPESAELELSPGHITVKNVTSEQKEHGVIFNTIDTVGLGMSEIKDKKMKEERKKANEEIRSSDLIIYCIPVFFSSKFDSKEIEKLDKNFGHDVWKKCIIAFTFSNEVLDRIKRKHQPDKVLSSYKKYICDYATKVEEKLSELKVRNISVKTVFDISSAVLQPADHTTILAIPAGDDRADQVLLQEECKPFKLVFKGGEQPFDAKTWIDVLFIALLSKSDSKKFFLLRQYFGFTGVQFGAIIGCMIGAIAFPPGVLIGAAIGAGVGASVDKINKDKREKKKHE